MSAPFLFSSVGPYQPVAIADLVYLQFMWGSAPPPLSSRACLTSVTVGSHSFSKRAGRRGSPHFPSPPAGLFIYSSHGEVPLPHSPVEHDACQPLLETCPSPSSLGGIHPCLLLQACLFTAHVGVAPLPLSSRVCHMGKTSPPFSRA
jgi:hypothetical protein